MEHLKVRGDGMTDANPMPTMAFASPGRNERDRRLGIAAWFTGNGPAWEQGREDRERAHAEAFAKDTRALYISAANGDWGGVQRRLESRLDTLGKVGGNANETREALGMVMSGDPAQRQALLNELAQADQIFVANDILEPVGSKDAVGGAKKTAYYRSGHILKSMEDGTDSLLTPGGRRLSPKDPEWGDEISLAMQSGVDQELAAARGKQQIELDFAGRIAEGRKAGEGQALRGQDVINFGLEAARGIPTIKRGLELLEFVDTGGFDNASLRVKQFFGVEGADEGELSANLGKAVLSQLRATFGAQFTEREGARLERIEAGFGKSTATNKRLLRQLLTMSEEYVIDAINRADDYGDIATVNQLMKYRAMTLDPMEQEPAPPQNAVPGVPAANKEIDFNDL